MKVSLKRSAFILTLSLGIAASLQAQTSWSPVKGRIASPWAERVDPSRVLPEYPRPQFVRQGNWKNLNGLWDYSITALNQQRGQSQGRILVPFAVESSLSGVGRTVGKDSLLWYSTQFTLPAAMKGKRILLHFGAVDWRSTVVVNGKTVGTHEGGFDPFSFDISAFLKKSGSQQLTVKVWDPTNEGPQPVGKQVKKPGGIWYTPVTGIWQTVWLEAVSPAYVMSLKTTPDIDRSVVEITPAVMHAQRSDKVRLSAWDGTVKVSEQLIGTHDKAVLSIPNAKLWDTKSPFLYDIKVELLRNGKVIDQAKSYFAMRKIAVGRDANGIKRMLLNNKFVFQYGPLDQGWWPDGLYTAPTDEALTFDIDKTKALGFNMIRKHIKVEPARWYHHCDRQGMLVWQDMPSGDMYQDDGKFFEGWESRVGILDRGRDKPRTAHSKNIHKKEWNAIMDALHNFPSIVVWVPFNEAWGQFETVEITKWTSMKDPSRLVNAASGGNFYPVGDILDFHHYPHPAIPDPAFFGRDYVVVLGEFGGLGLPVDGHVWQQKDNWGYQSFKNKTDLFNTYSSYIGRLEGFISKGLSAAVYTQTTDVEVETNGLMTYDRKVHKFPEPAMYQLHQKLYNPVLVRLP